MSARVPERGRRRGRERPAAPDSASGWKARLVGALVACVGVWPALHYPLVRTLDVNPWKLYGFAMYCTPHIVDVSVFDVGGAAPRRISSSDLPEPARSEYRRFLELRYVLGRMASPAGIARKILEVRPDVQALRIEIGVEQLGWLAHRATREQRVYEYPRETPAQPR